MTELINSTLQAVKSVITMLEDLSESYDLTALLQNAKASNTMLVMYKRDTVFYHSAASSFIQHIKVLCRDIRGMVGNTDSEVVDRLSVQHAGRSIQEIADAMKWATSSLAVEYFLRTGYKSMIGTG